MTWLVEAVNTVRFDRRGFECDKCGARHESQLEMQEAVTISVFGGYASVFGDGSELEAVFCQHCAKEMFGAYLRPTS